ncbi:MAG: hypothetical protein ACK4SA_13500 [Caldilinea sp.]
MHCRCLSFAMLPESCAIHHRASQAANVKDYDLLGAAFSPRRTWRLSRRSIAPGQASTP